MTTPDCMASLPTLAAIEFPGALRDPADPSRAIAALGGEQVVNAFVSCPASDDASSSLLPASRLSLNLRTGRTPMKSNIVSDPVRPTPNLFLLELIEREVAVPEPRPEHGKAKQAAKKQPPKQEQLLEKAPEKEKERVHDATKVQKRRRVQGRLVGRVTALTEFRALADFHYHPRPTFKLKNGAQVDIMPPTFEPNDLAGHLLDTLTNRPAKHLPLDILLERLCPTRFARSAPERGAMNYWYKQYAFPIPPRPRENALDEPADGSDSLIQSVASKVAIAAAAGTDGELTDAATTEEGVAAEGAAAAGPLALIPGRPLGDDGRSQPDRLDKLPHRVSYASTDVPTVAHIVRPPVHRGRQSYAQLLCLLKKLFKRRPVWVRRALLLGVPPELRTGFKKAISVVSYSFQGSGPFFQACIRYGYDPRMDPQSRKYQVIEVRCGHPLVEAARVIQDEQEQEQKKEKGNEEEESPVVHGLENPEDSDDEVQMDEEQLEMAGKVPLSTFQMPPEFLLNSIPKKRNNFFQFCDISLPPMIKALKKEKPGPKYSTKDGFFTAGGIVRLQTVAKSTLFAMSKEVVGEERSQEILRGNYKSISAMYSRKRGRVQLRDVMKEGPMRPRAQPHGNRRRKSVTRSELDEDEEEVEERERVAVDDEDDEDTIMPAHRLGVGGGEDEQMLDEQGGGENIGQLTYVMEGNEPGQAVDDGDDDGNDVDEEGEEGEDEEEDADELAAFEVYDSDSDGGLDDDGLDDDGLDGLDDVGDGDSDG